MYVVNELFYGKYNVVVSYVMGCEIKIPKWDKRQSFFILRSEINQTPIVFGAVYRRHFRHSNN